MIKYAFTAIQEEGELREKKLYETKDDIINLKLRNQKLFKIKCAGSDGEFSVRLGYYRSELKS